MIATARRLAGFTLGTATRLTETDNWLMRPLRLTSQLNAAACDIYPRTTAITRGPPVAFAEILVPCTQIIAFAAAATAESVGKATINFYSLVYRG